MFFTGGKDCRCYGIYAVAIVIVTPATKKYILK